jgi:hypothetical protein
LTIPITMKKIIKKYKQPHPSTLSNSLISSIEYKAGNFTIRNNDNSSEKLKLTKLEYLIIQEIKKVIERIANEKHISINLKE